MEKETKYYFTKIQFNLELSLWIILKCGLLGEKNRIEVRNYFVEKNYLLAIKIASSYHNRFKGIMPKEEFLSNAMLGLITAVDNYDISKGVPFHSYAVYRIRGEILDGVRATDLYSRRNRNHKKTIDKARVELHTKLDRDPVKEELLEYTGISDKIYRNLELASNAVQVYPIYDVNGEIYISSGDNPEKAYLENETREEVRKAIQKLPEKERKIIENYYYKGFKIKEVAAIVRLCKQRVRQLHKRAKERLKRKLKHLKDIR
jgi:RNA polymerase sigma factor for flagellar operon FliA